MVYPALLPLLPLMRTPRLPLVDWTDSPADLNGLVRFPERPNLVSARVPSHFKRALLLCAGRYLSSTRVLPLSKAPLHDHACSRRHSARDPYTPTNWRRFPTADSHHTEEFDIRPQLSVGLATAQHNLPQCNAFTLREEADNLHLSAVFW